MKKVRLRIQCLKWRRGSNPLPRTTLAPNNSSVLRDPSVPGKGSAVLDNSRPVPVAEERIV